MCNVSIIVPNYNHSKFLCERLDSIFNQTYQDFEVILLDDCSMDNSVEILKEYSNHPKVAHFVINEHNSGSPFKQWQKGIALASGDWIWIAESDDVADITFLDKLLDYNRQLNNCLGIIYCQSIDIDYNSKFIQNRINYTREFVPNIWENDFQIEGVNFIEKYLVKKNVIPNASGVIFRKDKIMPFFLNDQILNMRMAGDWVFWILICSNQSNVGFFSYPLNYFREHNDTTRIHNSFERKFKRLLEEKYIRDYLKKVFKLNQYHEIDILLRKWFEMHSGRNIFTRNFYALKPNNMNYIVYISNFLCFLKERKFQ
jgi:glycosyltransferase involved in cell wall biosynthesis